MNSVFERICVSQPRYLPRHSDGPAARYMTHMLTTRCRENGIEHRFTQINHPWTNGQVELMNRSIKEATVKHYYHDGPTRSGCTAVADQPAREVREHRDQYLVPSPREACVRTTRGQAEWVDREGFWAAYAAKAQENYGFRQPIDSKALRMSGFWLSRRFI